jgi:uridine kinase
VSRTNFTEETATSYRRRVYEFHDIDVILLEGIFLLTRERRGHFDLSVWIECGFGTALTRALARRQEGLTAAETAAAYRRIYFPAQLIHFERDQPREAADVTILNDPQGREGPASEEPAGPASR